MELCWLRYCGLGVAFTLLLLPSSPQAKEVWSRSFHMGIVRLMLPYKHNGRLSLRWRSPSGKWLKFSIHKNSHPGWLVRLRRFFKKAPKRPLVIGGKFFFLSARKAWVRITFVRKPRQVYRGLRVVKVDGHMPLFVASLLPRDQFSQISTYKFWGRVHTSFHKKRNALVCMYGTWFDFSKRSLGILLPEGGFRGELLYRFPDRFSPPKGWSGLIRWRKSILRYQKNRREHPQMILDIPRLPTLSEKHRRYFYRACKRRVSREELAKSSSYDPFYLKKGQTPPFQSPLQLFPFPPPKGTPL